MKARKKQMTDSIQNIYNELQPSFFKSLIPVLWGGKEKMLKRKNEFNKQYIKTLKEYNCHRNDIKKMLNKAWNIAQKEIDTHPILKAMLLNKSGPEYPYAKLSKAYGLYSYLAMAIAEGIADGKESQDILASLPEYAQKIVNDQFNYPNFRYEDQKI